MTPAAIRDSVLAHVERSMDSRGWYLEGLVIDIRTDGGLDLTFANRTPPPARKLRQVTGVIPPLAVERLDPKKPDELEGLVDALYRDFCSVTP